MRLAPANAAAHAHLGGLQMHLVRASEAKASLERAIELDPHQADPRFLLGNVGFEEGQLQEAIDCYFRAITIEPDDMESHTNICSA